MKGSDLAFFYLR